MTGTSTWVASPSWCVVDAHPQRVPGQHQGRLRQEEEPRQICSSTSLLPAPSTSTRPPGARAVTARNQYSAYHAGLFATALAFFDGYRTARLPQNLLQAQRELLRRPTLTSASTSPAASSPTPTGRPAAASRPPPTPSIHATPKKAEAPTGKPGLSSVERSAGLQPGLSEGTPGPHTRTSICFELHSN